MARDQFSELVSSPEGQEKLLEKCSDALLRATNECKAATPEWDICFESGSLNVLLAQKTLLNKMKGIVDAHNRLHAELSVHSVAVAYKCVLGSVVKACFLSQVCFSCSRAVPFLFSWGVYELQPQVVDHASFNV